VSKSRDDQVLCLREVASVITYNDMTCLNTYICVPYFKGLAKGVSITRAVICGTTRLVPRPSYQKLFITRVRDFVVEGETSHRRGMASVYL
jgi:hypothetical protein